MSAPIDFLELQLRNFLSFGNSTTTIDLSGSASTLIIGQNADTGGNNGAGKSTIINALCYALYNTPFDNISLQRLINGTNKLKNTLMEVRLSFKKGTDVYEVYRCRGESTDIAVIKNGNSMTAAGVSTNDNLVEEIIGMSYELFTKLVVFSGNSLPFLMMPISQQRQQIEELFNITLLSEKAIKLKRVIKDTEEAAAIETALIKEREQQVAIHRRQLADAEARIARWEDDRVRQVEKLLASQALLQSVDMNQEKELHELVQALSRQEGDLSGKQAALQRETLGTEREVKKLADELSHLVDAKCPYCLQKFKGAATKLAEKQALLLEKEELFASLRAETGMLQDKIAALRLETGAARAQLRYQSLGEALKAESGAASNQEKIDDLVEAENPHTDAFLKLQEQGVQGASTSALDELKKSILHQQFLLKLLTDKNSFIRRKIISRTIPFLNTRLFYYTKELGLPHTVKFDDNMSCAVSEYGRELDFGNLSSGEKKRVNLSLSLAFRDVLHHLHSRLNCLFIDEIDSSLDGTGVDHVFKLLKKKSRDDSLGLWIISHRPEAVGRFDRSLTVLKQHGFSTVVEEGK